MEPADRLIEIRIKSALLLHIRRRAHLLVADKLPSGQQFNHHGKVISISRAEATMKGSSKIKKLNMI